MKKIMMVLLCVFFVKGGFAQCFEIESILADACNGSPCPGSAQEGENEMVRFKIGSTALNYSNLSIIWPSTAAGGSSTPWRGIETSTAITTPIVNALNSTILSCGYLKEPVGGVLPVGASVLLITSTDMCTAGNSFANLADTLYVIFQISGNTQGHFTNWNATAGVRTLTMTFSSPAPCSDAVSYDRALLTNQSGGIGGTAAQRDGASIAFTPPGVATYFNNGCQAPIIPLTIDAGTAQSGCANAVFNLSAITTGQYSSVLWSGGTGTFGSANSLSTTYTPGAGESGTITFTVTINNTCGSTAADNIVLTLTAAPVPTITSVAGNSVCQGDSTQLTASGGSSFVWNPGNIAGASIYVSTQGTYTVTSTSACGTSNATFSLTVNASPVVGLSANDSSLCSGTTATLSASGANTYSWSAGTSAPNGTVVTTSPSSTASYTVTGTAVNGCTDTASVLIVVSPSPVISSSATEVDPGCGSSNGSISNLSITGSGNYTYSWLGVSGVVSTASSATNLSSGSYTVTVTDAVSLCSGTQTFSLNSAGGPPTPTFVASPTVCAGSGFTLTVSNPEVGATYTWSAPGVTTQTGVDLTSITIFSADTTNVGPYSVEVNAGGCSNFASVTATIAAQPVPSITGNLAFCQGANTVLDASASLPVSGSSFQWYQGGNPISGATNATYTATTADNYQVLVTSSVGCDSLSVATTVTVNQLPNVQAATISVCLNSPAVLSSSGAVTYSWSAGTTPSAGDTVSVPSSTTGSFTYTVTGTDSNNCTNTAVSTVQVNVLPVITSVNSIVCQGDTAIISAAGANTYTWSAGTTPSSGDTVSVSSAASGTFTYTVTGTDINNCVNTSTVTVVVSTSPNVQVANTMACINSSVNLVAAGATTYSWSAGTTPSSGDTVSVNTTAPGVLTYTVIGTIGNNCSDTAIVTLTVNPNPVININGMQNGTIGVCANQDTILAAGGANTYVWSTTETTTSITYATTANSVVSVVGTDVNGCVDSTTVNITLNAGPLVPPILGAPTICNGYPTILSVVDTITGQTYSWANSSGTILSTSDSVQISTIGNYTLTTTNSCGSTTWPVTIGQSTINVSFDPDTTIGVAPLLVGFTNTSTNATGYYWDFGNGATSTQISPETIYQNPGTYTVYLGGGNAAYCFGTYTVQIIVLEMNVYITMPNVFSPNGDGINDFFAVKSYGITKFNCQIYNRWGILVTELQNVNEKWTPDSNVSEGTYFYMMKATGVDGKEFENNGYLLLVK